MPIPEFVTEDLERAAEQLEGARAVRRRRREEESRTEGERLARIARARRTPMDNAELILGWVEEELRPVASAVKTRNIYVLWTLTAQDSGSLVLAFRDGRLEVRRRVGGFNMADDPVEGAAELARRFSRLTLASLADDIESGDLWKRLLEEVRRRVKEEVSLVRAN